MFALGKLLKNEDFWFPHGYDDLVGAGTYLHLQSMQLFGFENDIVEELAVPCMLQSFMVSYYLCVSAVNITIRPDPENFKTH